MGRRNWAACMQARYTEYGKNKEDQENQADQTSWSNDSLTLHDGARTILNLASSKNKPRPGTRREKRTPITAEEDGNHKNRSSCAFGPSAPQKPKGHGYLDRPKIFSLCFAGETPYANSGSHQPHPPSL